MNMKIDCKRLCRTCLDPNKLVELFPQNGVLPDRNHNLQAVVDAVQDCYGIKIQFNDEYSTMICHSCIQLVTLFHSSKLYARSADCYLHNCSVNQNLTSFLNTDYTSFPATYENASNTIDESKDNNDCTIVATNKRKEIGTTIDRNNILDPKNKRIKKESDKAKGAYALKKSYVKKKKPSKTSSASSAAFVARRKKMIERLKSRKIGLKTQTTETDQSETSAVVAPAQTLVPDVDGNAENSCKAVGRFPRKKKPYDVLSGESENSSEAFLRPKKKKNGNLTRVAPELVVDDKKVPEGALDGTIEADNVPKPKRNSAPIVNAGNDTTSLPVGEGTDLDGSQIVTKTVRKKVSKLVNDVYDFNESEPALPNIKSKLGRPKRKKSSGRPRKQTITALPDLSSSDIATGSQSSDDFTPGSGGTGVTRLKRKKRTPVKLKDFKIKKSLRRSLITNRKAKIVPDAETPVENLVAATEGS